MGDDSSINKEPQFKPQEPDGFFSVHSEPAIFPGQDGKLIAKDWRCSECGYNLRGLETGQRCPECGHIELYHPPPENAKSYATWLDRRRDGCTRKNSILSMLLAGLLAGPFAVLAVLVITPQALWLHTILIGPTLEEITKVAAAFWLIEARPWAIRDHRQIVAIGFIGGLVFAVLENLLYMAIFGTALTPAIFAWRWVACTTLHVCCSMIAAYGLVLVWRRTMEEKRPPKRSLAFPYLLGAIILHAAYNATVSALNWNGLLF